jgi:hypothetical protein
MNWPVALVIIAVIFAVAAVVTTWIATRMGPH